VEFIADKYSSDSKQMSECYCIIPIQRGISKVNVKFIINVFYSNELAYAEVLVDNSKCELDVEEVEF